MSTLFSGHYLRNRSNLDIGVLGYIGIVQHKEHSPEILSIPPGTPYIYIYIYIYIDITPVDAISINIFKLLKINVQTLQSVKVVKVKCHQPLLKYRVIKLCVVVYF